MQSKRKSDAAPARVLRIGNGAGTMFGLRSYGLHLRADGGGVRADGDPDDLIPRREKGEHDFHAVRSFIALREDGTPASFDREARTLEVVAATEEPVLVYDWEMGYVPEVLLMSGCKLPKSRQVPFQDAHNRWSVSDTLGSARRLRTEGDRLLADVHFSSTPEGESCMTKYGEGDLTDVSVGWRELKCVKLKEGEKRTIAGREWAGPMRVVTSWQIKELSAVPIGADERAKARAEQNTETEGTMDPKLLALLELRGLKSGATAEEAQAFMVSLGLKADASYDEALGFFRAEATPQAGPAGAGAAHQAGAGAQGADGLTAAEEAGKRAAAEYMQQEIKRASDIRGMCEQYRCPELADALIKENRTVDQARAAILDHVTGSRQTDGLHAPAGSISLGADAKDKYRGAIVYALVTRAGLKLPDLKEAPGHEDFRSYSLREIARHCLLTAGQSTRGDIMEVMGRALTTSDLPAILADVANKALFSGFAFHEETYELWTGTMPAGDFKALNIPSISSLDDLEPIGEHGEYKYGYMRDKNERITLDTAGKIYPITRPALINDDLLAITMMFSRAGQKAKKYEGDLVYALLQANPVMLEDGQVLFIGAHNNLATVIGPPSNASMDNMDAIMGAQVDQNGQPLNIPLTFAIMPRGMRGTGEAFFKTIQFVSAIGDLQDSVWGGDVVQRVYEPRLNTVPNTWYGAGPKGTSVVRTHLNGVQTPRIETRAGWNVDGVELRVSYDVAVGAVDYRGLVRNQ